MPKTDLTLLSKAVQEGVTERTTIARTFFKASGVDFDGKIGKTVDIAVRLLKEVSAKNYTAAQQIAGDDFDFDRFTKEYVAVKLEEMIYAALELDTTDTMEITNDNIEAYFPIIEYLIEIVVEKLELSAATTVVSGPNSTHAVVGADRAAQGRALIEHFQEMNLELTKRKVEVAGRTALVGDNVTLALQASKELLSAAESGSTGALREATIGRLANFNVVSSSLIPVNVAVFYGINGFVITSAAPGNLVSAAYSEVVKDQAELIDFRAVITSLGKRVGDGIIVQTYFSTAVLDANRSKKVTYNFTTPAA